MSGFAALLTSSALLRPRPVFASTAPVVDIISLRSEVFDNTRSLRVLLPPGYREQPHAHYPVFYLNDGVMVFRDQVGIQRVAQDLFSSGAIPPTIFVGIDNGASTDRTTNPPDDRANEFLPYPDVSTDNPEPPAPQGKKYPSFVLGEVMPCIENAYRVALGPQNTGIGGFSYGGTAALYTAVSRPGQFGALLLESTPLWMGVDEQLMRDVGEARDWPSRVYTGVGTVEAAGLPAGLSAYPDKLVESISHSSPRTAVLAVTEEGAEHAPSAWGGRLRDALTFLLGPATPPGLQRRRLPKRPS